MSRARKGAIPGIAIVVIGFGCFGGYELYEKRYLSSDLRRTLTAAMDPAATNGDIMAYVRDARLQIRTMKDAAVFQKFEECVQLSEDSNEINSRLFNDSMTALQSLNSTDSLVSKLVEIRSEYWREHIPVPKILQTQIDQALAESAS